LNEENIKKKVDALLKELQKKTGVSDEEIIELRKIMDIEYLLQDQE
tara:strand:+ start:568 stop:705 length:138 start_codon:yes stop_codon:yes gene_type:complete